MDLMRIDALPWILLVVGIMNLAGPLAWGMARRKCDAPKYDSRSDSQ